MRPDLTGIRTRAGDYVESELANRVNTDGLVGDVVQHWLNLNPERRRTVVYAVNVAHSVHIRDEFRRAGVLCEHIDGSTPVEERDRILAQLAAGKIEVVTNCQVLTEGWDCPEVGCIVLARPTKSLGLFRQMTGRGLRPALGKTDVLVLDHSGAVFQHGFVDDSIRWVLEKDQRAANTVHSVRGKHGGPPGLTICPECSAVRLEGHPCPVCGWRPMAKPRSVEFADGDLGEVSRDKNVHVLSPDRSQFYRELLWILKEKRQRNPGIKDRWAAAKYREKFGEWPLFAWRTLAPLEPSPATRAWVRSRDIAFAKALSSARAGAP